MKWLAKCILKSGATFEFQAASIEVAINSANGALATFKIDGMPDEGPKLVYLNPNDVAAIVVMRPYHAPQDEQPEDDGE